MTLASSSLYTGGPSVLVGGWIAVIIVAGAVAASIYGVWRVVWPAFKKMAHVSEVWPDMEAVASLAPIVKALEQEFRPNGGGSLRDTVDKNVRLTEDIKRVMEELRGRVSNLEKQVRDLSKSSE